MVAIGTTNSYQSAAFASGASYQTPTGLNVAAGVNVLIVVTGLTDNAAQLTSPTFTGSVATGTNPTLTGWSVLNLPSAGWYCPLSAWGNWNPFVGVFTAQTTDAVTDWRFTFDSTDAIYGVQINVLQLSGYAGLGTQYGLYNSTTFSDVTLALDDGTGTPAGTSINLVAVAIDGDPRAAAVAAGNSEIFESTTGPAGFIHTDPTPGTSIAWGTVTAGAGGAIAVALELTDSGAGPAQRPLAGVANAGIGTRATAGTTTVSLAYPAGVAAESLAIAGRSVKPSTATATAESGWTQGVNNTGGTGTQGIDTGPSRLRTDTRQLVGNESGSVVFDQASTPNAVTGAILIYSKDSRMRWELDSVSGTDNSHGTGRSHTSGSTVNLKPGDVVVCFLSSDTDDTTAYTSPAITASGITFGTTTERIGPGGAATGQDVGMMVYEATVTAGTGTVSLVMTLTGGPSSCGVAGWTRMRQVPKPFWDKFYV